MRKYVQPAVESEEMLEQTSLACNVTNLAELSPTCIRSYRKSEAYFDNEYINCSTVLLQTECMVALS
jgi:hypothetical protein